PGYHQLRLWMEWAAIVGAADKIVKKGDSGMADYLREAADIWNENIEEWTYAQDTELSKEMDVDGYYIRIAPPNIVESASKDEDIILIKNLPGRDHFKSTFIVSTRALALVRFGLRRSDDPKIRNTIKVIDKKLKTETPHGECWHRYNEDGYGEHEDGSAFDGTGIGRAWPLLTGERAHYELARDNKKRAKKLLKDMGNFSNEGGMIPEQVWDTDDIPEKDLFLGKPSGSAMPLVWAHSEYMKLCRSVHEGEVFDMPLQTKERYLKQKKTTPYDFWRFNRQISSVRKKRKKLRIEAHVAFMLHWSTDGWESTNDSDSKDTGLGIHFLDLDLTSIKKDEEINFTFYWPEHENW